MYFVANSEDVYNNIVIEYAKVAASLGLKNVRYIPMSAKNGDNIVEKSPAYPWYDGESLLHYLETVSYTHLDVYKRQGEDFRAGRWWWEDASKKECGLHVTTPSNS